MVRFSAAMLVKATRGQVISSPDNPGAQFRVSTDSRTSAPGDVFFALSGPRFDGHDFMASILELPGTGVVGEASRVARLPERVRRNRLVLSVADPLTALGDAARFVRSRLEIPVVGLTGSVGKTTTREVLRSILSRTGPGLATEGNLNNLIGLPLMMFRIAPEHRWVVLEMGMSELGEIARLSEIGCPDVRLITRVVEAHTEGVGGVDGVTRAKGELFAGARPGDIAVVNLDDRRIAGLPIPEGVQRVTFGKGRAANIRLARVKLREDGTLALDLVLGEERVQAYLPLVGRHNAYNALAAVAVAFSLEIPAGQIVAGLEACRGVSMRMEPSELPGGVKVVNDAYNANPASMKAAVETLRELAGQHRGNRSIAVLGDMLELGALEASAHRELGRLVAELDISWLFVCGDRAAGIAEGALDAGMPRVRVICGRGPGVLAEGLESILEPGDVVLIKGSRGARMERVLEELRTTRGKRRGAASRPD